MKILITGDWHLRLKRPLRRTDEDYYLVQREKVEQILKTALAEGASFILQPGDFFDSINTPYQVIVDYIDLFKKYKVTIYAVYGQHDLRYHSANVANTPLGVMKAVGVVNAVGLVIDTMFSIHGYSWNQPLLEKFELDESKFNILLLHKMIIDNEKLWTSQQDFTLAMHLLRRSGFDLIVSGDNHKSFVVESRDGKVLINCGSLMRSAVDQTDHKPVLYIFDTSNRTYKKIELKIKPAKNVLDLEGFEEEKERNLELETFIDGLDTEKDLGLNFSDNLMKALQEISDSDVVKMVEGILDEAEG